MTEELKIIISAQIDKLKSAVDEAQGKIDELASGDSKLSKLNDGFSKVGDAAKKGLAIAAGAVTGVGVALLSTVDATEEYRIAQSKLVSAFETAGSSAEIAKETYNDLYRVLGDGDVAVEAANHLAQLTTEEQSLNEWTEICQGVFATFGDSLPIESLTEAANETAKVGDLTGSLADALNWAGVNEEEFQAKLDACNTEAEREALIRETLTGLYGDAAAAYETNAAALLAQNEAEAKSAENMARIGEAMAPVKTMLTELGATLAEKVAPIIETFIAEHGPEIEQTLDTVAEGLGNAISWLVDNWDTVSTVATIIGGIAAALAVLSTGLGIYSTAMTVASTVSLPIIGIIAAIVAGIALLVAGIVLAVKHWDEITAAVEKFAEKVGEFFSDLWDSITGWISDISESISGWWEDTKQGFADWWGGLKEGWSEFWGNVGDKISEGVQKAKDKFTEMKDNISEKVSETKEKVSSKFEEIKSNISNKVNATKENVKSKFEDIKNSISEKLTSAKETAVSIFQKLDSESGGKLSTMLSNVKTKFDNIKNSIKEKMEWAKDKVKGIIDAIKGFFNFKFSWPKIPMPHFSISPSGWKIGDLLKGSIPRLSISWYAKGGVFDDPTLFGFGNGRIGGLGEDGAEAIVPLEKNTQWLDRIAERLRMQQQPMYLVVDKKILGQVTADGINDITAQTGIIPLNMF